MIKILSKHIFGNLRKLQNLVLPLIFLVAISCSDQGCIDADDFGEYESETIEVSANNSQNQCNYDPNKPLDESGVQGSGVIICFSTGSSEVVDENNVTYKSNTKGCMGFEDQQEPVARQLCIDACIQECSLNLSDGNKSEPNWTSTNKRSSKSLNYGVTIRPGSKIYVRAIGNIYLGDRASYPNIYVKADEYRPDSFDKDWNKILFDVKNQQSLNLKFSGEWNSGSEILGGGNTAISSTGNQPSDIELYRGIRRLVAYLIPHKDGYSLEANAKSEEEGSINVPLLPDSRAWKCSYSGTNLTEASCKNDENGYTNNGYTKVDNVLADETFPISSEVRKVGLGEYGGMIRWYADGIGEIDNSYNPFSSIISCTTSDCDIDNVEVEQGRMIGDLSTNITIYNPSQENSYKVSFKSIESSGICETEFNNNNPDISIYVVDKNDNPVHQYEDLANSQYVATNLNISQTSWTTEHISIEPNQKIIVSSSGITPDCGKVIAVKFLKYHDISIQTSGFVSFSILDALSGSCQINARIVNPQGSHSKAMFSGEYNASSNYEADFYEYENFSTELKDPLRNLTVFPRSTGNTGWTDPIFLRKGQIIRFSPESWNQTFETNVGPRKCGIGMAMKINPRPALLCRGKSSGLDVEYIFNPSCLLDYATDSSETIQAGDLLGCQENISKCTDINTNLYCPNMECRKDIIDCINPNISNNEFAKTGCKIKSSYTDIEVENILTDDDGNPLSTGEPLKCDTSSEFVINGNCGRCDAKRLESALIPAKIGVSGMDKCYDLENYKGKVSNISATSGFSETELSNPKIAKGATKLGFFNGNYGNFEDYYDTKSQEGFGDSNIIFEVKKPLSFASSGRLRFFVLDGNDFIEAKQAYENNSSSQNGYNYQNGFKLTLSGLLNFSNGQWLQAVLCKESSEDSTDCKTTNLNKISSNPAQPDLVEIDLANSTATSPYISTPYKFDDYGNLVRTRSPSNIDCKLDLHSVETTSSSPFYCHTYQFYNKTNFERLSSDNKKKVNNDIEKLRLSFKIIDPEINNCNITTGEPANSDVATGIRVNNPYYDSENESNKNKSCNPDEKEVPGPEDKDCKYEFSCVNKYTNNQGKYFVNVKVKSEISNGISNILGSVINPIIDVMDGSKRNCSTDGASSFFDGTKIKNPDFDSLTNPENLGETCLESALLCDKEFICKKAKIGQAERIYKLLISDPRYKAILNLSLIMMVTFFGLGYLMGVSELSHAELVSRIIKIGLIYLFVGETGWDWFNNIVVNFFKNGSDSLAFLMASSFDDSADIQSAINNSDFYDKSVLFSSVDRVFAMFFSDAILKKISALLFASLFGWAYLIVIIASFILYVSAVANAVLLYLTAQVFTSILFTLGPIFFIFTLFGPTKEMFDNWLKSLISFSLQQILLLITLAFFNMLMYEVIKMSLGFKICWEEVWTINIITRISLLSFWTVASLPPRTNPQSEMGNIGNPDGIPSLFSILFIWVIASLMNKFIGFMVNLASDISGGLSASKMASGVVASANKVKGMAKDLAGKAYEKSGLQEKVQRADMALFDSGALADKERDAKKLQNRKDISEKAKIAKGGKQAVEEFKKENMSKLNSMSQAERQQTLNKVKKEGEIAAGKKMGLDDKRIKDLRESKGLKHHHDTNVVGAALSYARQGIGGAISGDGTINKSLSDQDADTSFSKKTAKAGMSKMTAEQKDDFKNNNNLDIKKTNLEKIQSKGKEKLEKLSQTMSEASKGNSTAIAQAVASPTIPLQAAARKASEVAKNAMGAIKDRSEAISQLEKEGAITKMTPGTNSLRDKEEKNTISKRIEENKKQQSVNTKKPNIEGSIALEKEIDKQNLKEELSDINSDPSLSKEEKATKTKEAKEKRKTNPEKIREKLEKKYQDDLKAETNETLDTLDELAGSREFDEETGEFKKETSSKDGKTTSARTGGKMGALKEQLKQNNKEKEEYLQSEEGQQFSQQIAKLEETISNPKSSSSQKESAENKMQLLKDSNEKLSDFDSKEDKISSEIHDTQRQIDNYNKKLNNLGYNEQDHEKEISSTKIKSDVASGEGGGEGSGGGEGGGEGSGGGEGGGEGSGGGEGGEGVDPKDIEIEIGAESEGVEGGEGSGGGEGGGEGGKVITRPESPTLKPVELKSESSEETIEVSDGEPTSESGDSDSETIESTASNVAREAIKNGLQIASLNAVKKPKNDNNKEGEEKATATEGVEETDDGYEADDEGTKTRKNHAQGIKEKKKQALEKTNKRRKNLKELNNASKSESEDEASEQSGSTESETPATGGTPNKPASPATGKTPMGRESLIKLNKKLKEAAKIKNQNNTGESTENNDEAENQDDQDSKNETQDQNLETPQPINNADGKKKKKKKNQPRREPLYVIKQRVEKFKPKDDDKPKWK